MLASFKMVWFNNFVVGGYKQDNEGGCSSLCRSIMIQCSFLTAGCCKLNIGVWRGLEWYTLNVIVVGCSKEINEIY
jgi:hypothetical protein